MHKISRFIVPVILIICLAVIILFLSGCAGSGSDNAGYSQSSSLQASAGPTSTVVGSMGGTALHGVPEGTTGGSSSGDLKIEFPQGLFQSDATVTLRDKESPSAPLNATVLLSHSHTIEFPAGALSAGSSSAIQVHFPYLPNEHYIAAVGYLRNGVYLAFPVTQGAAGVDATVPVDVESGKSESGDTFSAEISLVEIPVAEELSGSPSITVSKLDNDGSWEKLPDDGAQWQGTRIALLVHGIMGKSDDLLTLARHLKTQGSYDNIYAVDYPLHYKIDSNGSVLGDIIKKRTPSGIKIDIFAWSLGGLVSRSAIELHGASAETKRLICMGTPHNGVKAASLLSCVLYIVFKYWLPEINDLAVGSDFMKKLNGAGKVDCTYFSAVGTDATMPEEFPTVKKFGLKNVKILIGGSSDSVVDGMVAADSAGYDLSGKCASWSTQSFPVNHNYISGGRTTDPYMYDYVFTQIDKWLSL